MAARGDLAATVRRALAQAGDVVRLATLTRREPGAYDPRSGEPGVPAVSECGGLAFFGRSGRLPAEADGLVIEPEDAVLWLAAVDFAPLPGDTVTIDGRARVLRGVEDLAGAGVLYLAVAR